MALWHMTGALRIVLDSGFACHVVFALGLRLACLLRSIANAVCPSAPKGAPSEIAPWKFSRFSTSATDPYESLNAANCLPDRSHSSQVPALPG